MDEDGIGGCWEGVRRACVRTVVFLCFREIDLLEMYFYT